MVNDTTVTVRGFVGSEVITRETHAGTLSEFRVGVSRSLVNRETRSFETANTSWYRVSAWGSLGKNVAICIRKGMPVLVRGRITISRWQTDDGQERLGVEISADSVGVEIRNGTATYNKTISDPTGSYASEDALQAIEAATDFIQDSTAEITSNTWEFDATTEVISKETEVPVQETEEVIKAS